MLINRIPMITAPYYLSQSLQQQLSLPFTQTLDAAVFIDPYFPHNLVGRYFTYLWQ
jgi:hypothetical protein